MLSEGEDALLPRTVPTGVVVVVQEDRLHLRGKVVHRPLRLVRPIMLLAKDIDDDVRCGLHHGVEGMAGGQLRHHLE